MYNGEKLNPQQFVETAIKVAEKVETVEAPGAWGWGLAATVVAGAVILGGFALLT